MAHDDSAVQDPTKQSPSPPLTQSSGPNDPPQPVPFTRRPSLSSSARIFPIKSVAHPPKRAGSEQHQDDNGGSRGNATSSTAKPSPVLASPSEHPSTESKPASLDPYLDQPTTHEKYDDDRGGGGQGDTASTTQDGSMSSDKLFHMTTRFEHKVGDDGEHLVVTGRNAQIQRCEDEVSLQLAVAIPFNHAGPISAVISPMRGRGNRHFTNRSIFSEAVFSKYNYALWGIHPHELTIFSCFPRLINRCLYAYTAYSQSRSRTSVWRFDSIRQTGKRFTRCATSF